MTIPITFQGQSASGAPQGKRSAAAIQFPNVINLKRAPQRGKQKGKASAAFLGVPAIPGNVVTGCCIPTTTLTDSRTG
jgi:hypothetical protein